MAMKEAVIAIAVIDGIVLIIISAMLIIIFPAAEFSIFSMGCMAEGKIRDSDVFAVRRAIFERIDQGRRRVVSEKFLIRIHCMDIGCSCIIEITELS